jgi:hypothetical protein
MTTTDTLIASVLGALIVWIVSGIVSHFIRRARLRTALLANIAVNIAGEKEQRAAVINCPPIK